MLTHSWWWLAVDGLAVYRLAVLIGKDMIAEPIRQRVGTRMLAFITCPWCIGLWFAAAAVILTRFWPQGWQYVAMALALSAVAGFLGER